MGNYVAAALIAAASLWLLTPPRRPAPAVPRAVQAQAEAEVEDAEPEAGPSAKASVTQKKALRILLIERTTRLRLDDGATSEAMRSTLVVGDGEARLATIAATELAPGAEKRSLGERVVAGLPCVGSVRTLHGTTAIEEWRGKKTDRLVRRVVTYGASARTDIFDFYLLTRRASAALFERARKGKL